MFDVLSGKIDSPKIISLLNIHVKVLRNNANTFLRIRGHRSNYGSSEPILRMFSFFNEVYYLFDFGQPTNIVFVTSGYLILMR